MPAGRASVYKRLLFVGLGALGMSGLSVSSAWISSLSSLRNEFEDRFLDYDDSKNQSEWDKLAKLIKEKPEYRVNKFSGLKGVDSAEKLKNWCRTNTKKKINRGVFSTSYQIELADAISVYCFMNMERKLKRPETSQEDATFKNIFTKTLKTSNDVTDKQLKRMKDLDEEKGSKELMYYCWSLYSKGFIKEDETLYKLAQKYCQKQEEQAKK